MTSTVLLLFWNLVLYLLLVLLSISWYQDTAQRGCQLVGRRCRSPADALAAWRELLETATSPAHCALSLRPRSMPGVEMGA